MVKVRDVLNEAIGKYDGALELVRAGSAVDTNGLGFYVDGYTLNGTSMIDELKLTAFDGREVIVKTAALTAWIERRLPQKDA